MKQLLIFLLFFKSITTFSQTNFSINGFIIDEDTIPIEIADVILLSKKNKITLKYSVVENGKFNLENIKKGEYILKVISLTHLEIIKEINLNNNISLNITAIKETNTLDTVEIIGSKKLFKNKKGNLVIDVENSSLAKESSSINLLAKLPKLQINEAQESIELIGKGTPLIYINNQRVSFNMLTSLQVDEIKTIEIINNPSSKYEANATGVILITLKKNIKDGFILNLKETASFKTYSNNYFSSYLNFKKNALEIKLSSSINHTNVWESNAATYNLTNKNITSDYVVTALTNRKQAIINGGVFFQINNHDYFSINTNTQIQEEPFSIDTKTNYTENSFTESVDTKSTNFGSRILTTTTLNYQKKHKILGTVFFGAQHSHFDKNIKNSITNTSENIVSNINRVQNFTVNSNAIKLNYEKEFSENNLLEFGINYTNIKTATKNINTYMFSEKNGAMYTQFSSKLYKETSFSIGARLEKNKALGYFENTNEIEYEKENVQFFPNVNLQHQLNNKQSLIFNYNASVVRPNFSSISNTSAFINPYLEFTGNLNLENANKKEVSLNYTFNNKSIKVAYTHIKDPIRPYSFNYEDLDNTTTVMPLNLIKNNSFNLEINTPFKYKFWSSENILSFTYANIEDDRVVETRLKPYLYYYSNHQFRINKSTSFNFNLWGITNSKENAYITEPVFTINTSFYKKIRNLDITLSYNDIFKSLKFNESYTLNNINVNSTFFTDVNEFSISLKYNLGIIKKSNYKNKSILNTNRIR